MYKILDYKINKTRFAFRTLVQLEQAHLRMTYAYTNGPREANLVLIAYAHPHSLARTFAARSYQQWVKRNLQTDSQIPGPSEWLSMRS